MKKQEKTSKNTSTQPTKIEQNLNINITSHVFETLAKLEKVIRNLLKKHLNYWSMILKIRMKKKRPF